MMDTGGETKMTREPLPQPIKKPHVELNEDLVKELERSYYDETDIEVGVGPCELSRDLIRQGQIFARRTKTSFTYRFGKRDGKDYMVFNLGPKRSYTLRNTEYWESL